MKPIVYIAGKVTGLPYEQCFAKFEKVEKEFIARGYEVINPMKIVEKDASWNKAMEICIKALFFIHYQPVERLKEAYFMPCWVNSNGAKLEKILCENLDLNVVLAIKTYKDEKF